MISNINWVLEFKTKKMKKKLEKGTDFTYEEKQKAEGAIIADIFLKKAMEKKIVKDKEKQGGNKNDDTERKMIRGSKKIQGISSHTFRTIEFLRNSFKTLPNLSVPILPLLNRNFYVCQRMEHKLLPKLAESSLDFCTVQLK